MSVRLSVALVLVALVLLILSVVPWPSAATSGMAAPTAADVAYGRDLFQAKGCASCHQHGAVAGSGQFSAGWTNGSAPVLTTYPADPTDLRAWLHDPQAIKPATLMPNLGLSDTEITALIAFLKSAPAVSR
jgi:cytochrome c2